MVTVKIENDKIIEAQLGQNIMKPKMTMTLDEHYSELREHARYFEENFDILPLKGKDVKATPIDEGYPWNEAELIDFLEWNTSSQDLFLEALMENKGKTYVEDVVKYFERKGKTIKPRACSGITAGFTKRTVSYGSKEPFVDSFWDEKGTYYTIKDQYKDIIKKHLEKESKGE